MHKKRIETDNKRRKMGSKTSEIERRNEGLQVPIKSDNKGFSMLQKMGYKPGMGIGKKGLRFKSVLLTFMHIYLK